MAEAGAPSTNHIETAGAIAAVFASAAAPFTSATSGVLKVLGTVFLLLNLLLLLVVAIGRLKLNLKRRTVQTLLSIMVVVTVGSVVMTVWNVRHPKAAAMPAPAPMPTVATPQPSYQIKTGDASPVVTGSAHDIVIGAPEGRSPHRSKR